MTGGGHPIQPGAASLAHRGVLLLQDAPEFTRAVLDSLRQPLETGQITITKSYLKATFPARFLLITTARPCPCGAETAGDCTCTAAARRRYTDRLQGPLLDRTDIKIRLALPAPADVPRRLRSAEPSKTIAQRVAAARQRSAHRLNGTPWRLNAQIPAAELRRSHTPEPRALRELDRATELGQVSTPRASKIIRIAWTIADLTGRNRPGKDEIHTALHLFLGKEKP